MALAGAFFFGFVPMFLFAGFVYWLDRYEKEPKLLLGATFIWGVVIAGGGAMGMRVAGRGRGQRCDGSGPRYSTHGS